VQKELRDYIIYHIPSIPKVGCMFALNFQRRRWQGRAKDHFYPPHRLTREGELVTQDERVEVLLVMSGATAEHARSIENFFQRLYGCLVEKEEKALGARNRSHEASVRAGRIGGRNGSHEDKVRAGRIGGPIGIRKLSREDKAKGGRNRSHEASVRAGRAGGLVGGPIGGRAACALRLTCPECGRVMNPANMGRHRKWHEGQWLKQVGSQRVAPAVRRETEEDWGR
jgi:hypothetical protein